MRFFHIADLHFGKSIYKVSLLEDQKDWVKKFVEKAVEKEVDAVVIAGDVYDRGSPSDGAVYLLDKMLTELSEHNIPVLMVAGNDDSSQKLAFGSQLFKKHGVHISRPLESSSTLNSITFEDTHGPVTFWLMPYVYPALIGKTLEREEIRNQTFDSAVRSLLKEQHIDTTQRNVLIAHQNVTNNGKEAERGGSESTVGGLGQIDYTAFTDFGFDYVALGHIHSSCQVGKKTIRYAGTPMCYHFNETHQPNKGAVLVELGAKGIVSANVIEIEPLHPMREIKDPFDKILKDEKNNTTKNEYIKVILTDQPVQPAIYDELQKLFSSRQSILMEITSDYNRSIGSLQEVTYDKIRGKSLEELFDMFYADRSEDNQMPDEKDKEFLHFAGELQENHRNNTEQKIEELADELLNYLKRQEGV